MTATLEWLRASVTIRPRRNKYFRFLFPDRKQSARPRRIQPVRRWLFPSALQKSHLYFFIFSQWENTIKRLLTMIGGEISTCPRSHTGASHNWNTCLWIIENIDFKRGKYLLFVNWKVLTIQACLTTYDDNSVRKYQYHKLGRSIFIPLFKTNSFLYLYTIRQFWQW